jgi:hypothetical protein
VKRRTKKKRNRRTVKRIEGEKLYVEFYPGIGDRDSRHSYEDTSGVARNI